jgi:RNA-directed DNA polymerase
LPNRSASESFTQATTQSHLQMVFRSFVMNGGAIGRDGIHPRQLENDWDSTSKLLQRKMRDGSYQFTSFREVVLSKGARSLPRVVSIPTARDRIALKVLAQVLVSTFPNARTPMAQVRVGELVSALANRKRDAFVRVDVKDFYPSISHNAINAQLRKRIRSRPIRHLISRAISTQTVPVRSSRPNRSTLIGVPQGLSISNALAEIAMTDIDAHFQADGALEYFRYVDDILILCDQADVVRVVDAVKLKCLAIGLAIHPLEDGSKTQVGPLTDTFDYLGYLFTPKGVSVRPSSVQKLESTIVQLFTAYKYDLAKNRTNQAGATSAADTLKWKLDLVITGCVFDHIPRGWLHYFSQANDLTLLSRLDAYVSGLKVRFGLPTEFRSKLFVRTYWLVTRPSVESEKYIPNFDKYSEAQKRALLTALFPSQTFDKLTSSDLIRRFRAEITRVVSMLERDVSETS